MLKIGVCGAGHLGKIHIQQWKTIEEITLVGFYEPNDQHAAQVISEYQIYQCLYYYGQLQQQLRQCHNLRFHLPHLFRRF